MPSAAVTSRPSQFQLAMSAALLLAGLSLFYAFRGGDVQGAAASAAPESIGTQPEQVQASHGPARAHAARSAAPDEVYDMLLADPASGLAQMHKSMTDVPAQRDARDQLVARLESEHRAEPVDAAWSAQSEVDILSASVEPVMIQGGFQPRDVATECRSRTCRISARFANSGDAQDWSDSLVMQMGGTLSQVKATILPQRDGSSEVRIYGARAQPTSGGQARSRLRI